MAKQAAELEDTVLTVDELVGSANAKIKGINTLNELAKRVDLEGQFEGIKADGTASKKQDGKTPAADISRIKKP